VKTHDVAIESLPQVDELEKPKVRKVWKVGFIKFSTLMRLPRKEG